jgi:hypothetical protein
MKKILLCVLVSGACTTVHAQVLDQYIKGHFNGSFESYTQNYFKDEKIGADKPLDNVSSNNFLKLDYVYGKFSAGIQMESYLPPLLGFFPIPVNNQTKIVNKYFKYTDEHFSVQVGDFYEQFGSGLIFRALENRQIGINNALEGFNVHVSPTKFLKIKTIYGRTRKIFDYTNTVTRGIDADLDINKLIAPKNTTAPIQLNLGGSYVGKYQEYAGGLNDFPSTVHAYAGRFDLTAGDFAMDAEYVDKGADPNILNNFSFDRGKAFLLNLSYTKNNFGFTGTYRSLYNMNFLSEREMEFASVAPVNFIPALTKQHDYLTSNIYVYAAQNKGESGFQTDIFYHCEPGSLFGGKYGTKIAFNASVFGGLKDSANIFGGAGEQYFTDINLEIKKKLSKKFELTIGLQKLFYNATAIQAVSEGKVNAYVTAIGGLYKFAPKKSIRFKVEHLQTANDKGSWASAVTEFSFSSPYAFFISDLFNYGSTKNHYYNFGASVTKKSTRFSLSYGKQRAGLFCVGGVCRFVPASYGFTASLTTNFSN